MLNSNGGPCMGQYGNCLGVGMLDKKEDGTYEKLGNLYGTWMPDGAANIIGEANGFSFHFDSFENNGWKITLIGE